MSGFKLAGKPDTEWGTRGPQNGLSDLPDGPHKKILARSEALGLAVEGPHPAGPDFPSTGQGTLLLGPGPSPEGPVKPRVYRPEHLTYS